MSFTVKRVFVLGSALALGFGILTWFLLFRYQVGPYRPLQEGYYSKLPTVDLSKADQERFLEGDFVRLNEVRALPLAVRSNYLEPNGSRFTMANPGKPFQSTDLVLDASMPSKRLIFAGQKDDRFLVHFEQGGIAHSYLIAFFQPTSDKRADPIWLGYCGRAAVGVADLRNMVRAGECRSMLEIEHDAMKNFESKLPGHEENRSQVSADR
jgi:hypothetical protein